MFKASLAIKRPSKKPTEIAATATTSVEPATQLPIPSQGQGPVTPFVNYTHPHASYPQSYMTPPFMGYGMPYPPFFPPGMVTTPTKMHQYPSHDPPSSPVTVDCTVSEFCKSYNLGEKAEIGLENLGFRFGDDLSTVSEKEYTDAGFKPLEWRRVLKAYGKLKREHRD